MCPDELMTDDLMRIFAERDARRAKKATKTVVKYRPKVQVIEGTRAAGSSYLESSPLEDEFIPSGSHYENFSRAERVNKDRDKKRAESSGHKNKTRPHNVSSHSRSKDTVRANQNAQRSKNTKSKNSRYQPKHAVKAKHKKLNSFEKTMLGIASGATIGATALTAFLFSTPDRGPIESTIDKFEHQPGVRIYETDENYNDATGYTINGSDGEEYTLEIDDEGNAVVSTVKDTIVDKIAEAPLGNINQMQIDNINLILEENPDIKDAFNDTEVALRRASIEYGGNVIELLEEMNDKFGLGKLPLEWQIGLLEHESTGFFTDWKTGEVIVRKNGDTGWYQITDIVEEDFDRIANFLEKRGVSREDLDEIKALGRSSMRGNAGYGAMYLSYLNLLFDGDIEKVLSGFNAGEGFVKNGNTREGYVQECYGDHIEQLNRYDDLWEYIIRRDYNKFEDDGVPHAYVNSEDGSVRYPD